jgi:hypothetical protein
VHVVNSLIKLDEDVASTSITWSGWLMVLNVDNKGGSERTFDLQNQVANGG